MAKNWSIDSKGFGTVAIHAGQDPEPRTGAVSVPISLASTFAQRSPGEHTGFEYSRTGNPTRQAFEECVAACEGGKYGLAFGSGSAALATVIGMLSLGDHVISGDDLYGGTNRFFNRVVQGINFSFVDMTDLNELERSFTPKTKLVWLETPTNPTLKIFDIKKICEMAHRRGVIVAVDNTFVSPYFQQPLKLGADLVCHSVSKYIGGHSDVVMGVIATSDEKIYEKLKFLQNAVGAIPSPFDCYMALRGLKTLHLRMEAHARNAMTVAKFLEAHPKVERVIYPGLPSHPQHDLAKRQMRGFGGMITFYVKGGINESRAFLENLKVVTLAESLGAVESLIESPVIMTHAAVPPEQRKKLGISDNLIRFSVGVEQIDDILDDLKRALNAIPQSRL